MHTFHRAFFRVIPRHAPWLALSFTLALAPALPALAQTTSGSTGGGAASVNAAAPGYQPSVGQEGKDVIWVPTPPGLVQRMLVLGQVTARDHVVDLGAGDGRIAIAAAKRGARALGVEFNPEMVDFANRAAQEAGVLGTGPGKATIVQGDIFERDFTRATVVTMYLLTALNLRLRPQLLEMKPGTRVVAHQFRMGDWEPDETSHVDGHPAHLWIVPARVAGLWKVTLSGSRQPVMLELEQSFQKLKGSVDLGKLSTTLREARLQGDAIRIAYTDADGRLRELAGRVADGRMGGEARGSGPVQRWQAVRER